MRKTLAYALFFLGAILLAGAGFAAWQAARLNAANEVPPSIGGLNLTQVRSGQAGLESINKLHGLELELSAGTVAQYGNNEGSLWLADAGSDAGARDMIRRMQDKIANGNSPFTPMGVFKFQDRDVYLLSGMGQTHFYAQAGSRVFWVSIAADKAEQALKEMLSFYK